MLDIIASYHFMQFQGKRMIQIQENGEKPHFGHDLSPLGPNSGSQIFFSKIWLRQSLDLMFSYHHVQYQKKLMILSWENLVTDGQADWPTNVERPKTSKQNKDFTLWTVSICFEKKTPLNYTKKYSITTIIVMLWYLKKILY